MLNLGDLATGDIAVIVAIRAEPPLTVTHYAARGLVPGAEVAVLQLGDPIAVALEETRWAISKAEAARIEVAVVGREERFRWWSARDRARV